MAAYPSSPIAFDSFVEVPRAYQTIKTGFEAGYAQTRAKSTTAPRQFQFLHKTILAADVTTWVAFWDARLGGADSFDFTDPRTGAVISCRFKHDASNPPQVSPIGSANVAFTIGPITLEEVL